MSFSSNNKPKIVVGLSGGVDSSVTAWCLKQQGYDVEALFMKNWDEENDQENCSYADDLRAVKQVCDTLDIPLHTINFAYEYWESVFQYFLDEYRKGRTPNPDILCNREIKFKHFLTHAQNLGAEKIATGHYVRCLHDNNEAKLYKGKDLNKDQSYFLYALNQYQLESSLFPIGEMEKPKVREIAKELNLVTHNKKDSTGICFIGERNFKNFLQEYLPAQQGLIQTIDGETIGEHDGLMYYTLGQRQGLGIGGLKTSEEKPWFVAAKDLKNNILIAVQGHDHPWLLSNKIEASQINWISTKPPTEPFEAKAKVRYRHQEARCIIKPHVNGATITFTEPQWAVTPGQSVVFYKDEHCLGGGIIETTDSQGGLLD